MKSTDEIRKNAPDGATGYIENESNIYYIKGEMIWFRDSWFFATFDTSEIKPL